MFNKVKRKLRDFKNIVLVFFPDNKIKIEVIHVGNHYQKKEEIKQITITGLVLAEEIWKEPKKPRPLNSSTSAILVPASFEDAKKTEFEAALHVLSSKDRREFLVYRGREPTSGRDSTTNGGDKET